MIRRVIVRAVAEADLADAVAWYQPRRAGLGQEFLDEIDMTLDAIAERAESFPVDFGNVRRALVHRFPYAVHFILRDDLAIVLAVLHQRQDTIRHLGDRT